MDNKTNLFGPMRIVDPADFLSTAHHVDCMTGRRVTESATITSNHCKRKQHTHTHTHTHTLTLTKIQIHREPNRERERKKERETERQPDSQRKRERDRDRQKYTIVMSATLQEPGKLPVMKREKMKGIFEQKPAKEAEREHQH